MGGEGLLIVSASNPGLIWINDELGIRWRMSPSRLPVFWASSSATQTPKGGPQGRKVKWQFLQLVELSS
jgi:hypothetical protein